MKYISLTNSDEKAIIDDDDYDRIVALNTDWYVKYEKEKPTAILSTKHLNDVEHIYLHRFIMNCVRDNGYDVDHKNRNIFDNQKDNLRVVTFSQNMMNTGKRSDNTSGHKNICWDKRDKLWVIQAQKDGKHYLLGRCKIIEEAIKVRDVKIKEFFGEFTNLC